MPLLRIGALCLVLLAIPAEGLAQQEDAARKPREPSAAAGATAPTPAIVDPREADRLFSRFDTDRDGRLSSAELEAARTNEGNWMAIDRNRDGRITRDEFTALVRE